MTQLSRYPVAALAAMAAACAPEAPEAPTWTEDVRPILLANCARCHAPPSIRSAPVDFRLDVYGPTQLDDGTMLEGAEARADAIAARAGNGSMPPEFPLTERQREVLERWADMGAPRGEIPAGNEAPSIELLRPLADSRVDDGFAIQYRIDDPDFDYVTGVLRARNGDEDVVVTRELHSGRGEITWNVSGLAGQSYELVALLDDGRGQPQDEISLGEASIAAAAPRVRLLAPGAEAPLGSSVTARVSGVATPAALTVTASRDGRRVVLADGVPAAPGDNEITVDRRALEPGAWRLEIAIDGANGSARASGDIDVPASGR